MYLFLCFLEGFCIILTDVFDLFSDMAMNVAELGGRGENRKFDEMENVMKCKIKRGGLDENAVKVKRYPFANESCMSVYHVCPVFLWQCTKKNSLFIRNRIPPPPPPKYWHVPPPPEYWHVPPPPEYWHGSELSQLAPCTWAPCRGEETRGIWEFVYGIPICNYLFPPRLTKEPPAPNTHRIISPPVKTNYHPFSLSTKHFPIDDNTDAHEAL